MSIADTMRGDAWGNPNLYFAVGLLSVAKALAVRRDPERFRRELLDGLLFLGTGLLIRKLDRGSRRQSGAADRVRSLVAPARPRLPDRARRRHSSGGKAEPASLGVRLRRRLP